MIDRQLSPGPASRPALLVRRAVAGLGAVVVFDAAVVGVGLAVLLLFPWGPSYLFGDMLGYRVLGGGLLSGIDARLAVAVPVLLASLLITILSPGGRGPFLRALGLTVVDEVGDPPSMARRVLRWAGLCMTALVFGIPAIWALFDRYGRAPHDILSGTRVLRLHQPGRED